MLFFGFFDSFPIPGTEDHFKQGKMAELRNKAYVAIDGIPSTPDGDRALYVKF